MKVIKGRLGLHTCPGKIRPFARGEACVVEASTWGKGRLDFYCKAKVVVAAGAALLWVAK